MSQRISRSLERIGVVLSATGLLVALSGPAGAMVLVPSANSAVPTSTVASFAYACRGGIDTSPCVAAQVRVINVFHAREGARPMVLPSDWARLSPTEQLFVLADLERVDRGLAPYLGLNAALDAEAQRAAVGRRDPAPAPGFPAAASPSGLSFGGTWAGTADPLTADYGWMYNDGWAGTRGATANLLCTGPLAPGCWGHREELLGYDPTIATGPGLFCATCEMGTGYVAGGGGSTVDLVEGPAGTPPPMTFTWSHDVVPFLPARALGPGPLSSLVPGDPLPGGQTESTPALVDLGPSLERAVAAVTGSATAGDAYEVWFDRRGDQAMGGVVGVTTGTLSARVGTALPTLCGSIHGTFRAQGVTGWTGAAGTCSAAGGAVAVAWADANRLEVLAASGPGVSLSGLVTAAEADRQAEGAGRCVVAVPVATSFTLTGSSSALVARWTHSLLTGQPGGRAIGVTLSAVARPGQTALATTRLAMVRAALAPLGRATVQGVRTSAGVATGATVVTVTVTYVVDTLI